MPYGNGLTPLGTGIKSTVSKRYRYIKQGTGIVPTGTIKKMDSKPIPVGTGTYPQALFKSKVSYHNRTVCTCTVGRYLLVDMNRYVTVPVPRYRTGMVP